MSFVARIVAAAAAAGLVFVAIVVAMPGSEPTPTAQQQQQAARPTPGAFMLAETRQPMADLIFHDAEGAERRLSEFRGKTVLINFWATWCPPCIAEMPSLAALQAELAPAGFVLLALSQDRGGIEVAARWLDGNSIDIDAYVVDSSQARAAGTLGQLPVSILVDAQGREVGRVFGATDWHSSAMVARVKAVMAENRG